ncbi:MAG: gamma-glutamyltransferase, partial [Synergistes sp.]|nr:gamma-glutamyltransferase [Synergistes sp.]
MRFDPTHYMYPSRRTIVYASRGMVATTQPAAAQAGVEAMRRGGNAIDAAVAAAAALTVTEPVSNGIGGDAFAIVWSGGRLYGLNASGWAPALTDAEKLRAKYGRKMPQYGWDTVTVPGAPSAWAALSSRFGRLPFSEVLEPAVRCAREGFPVSVNAAILWKRRMDAMKKELRGEEFSDIFDTFTCGGKYPGAGDIWRSELQARTLEKIAASGAEAFYRGELAEIIDTFSRRTGGTMRAADLAAYEPEWTEPISVNYNGYDIWEIPPNG